MKHEYIYTEAEAKAYATERAKSIVIRSYDERGNSADTRRESSDEERWIIAKVIYGALLAICEGHDVHSANNTAEYIADLMIPGMNGYDSVYNPIRDFLRPYEA